MRATEVVPFMVVVRSGAAGVVGSRAMKNSTRFGMPSRSGSALALELLPVRVG